MVARFEAERQALALMDHPNIAKVLDALATASGRPYFLMEFVVGVPIAQYCEANRLGLPERPKLAIEGLPRHSTCPSKGIKRVLFIVISSRPMFCRLSKIGILARVHSGAF